jgi:hypothetical protein
MAGEDFKEGISASFRPARLNRFDRTHTDRNLNTCASAQAHVKTNPAGAYGRTKMNLPRSAPAAQANFVATFLLFGRGGRYAADYLITLSACSSMRCGITRPSCSAVLRLMTISNLAGSLTGRSPGLAPFRISTTYSAARRYKSSRFGP